MFDETEKYQHTDRSSSFDDEKTIQEKVDFANNRGLHGLMVWAVDIDDDKGTALRALTGNRKTTETTDLAQFLQSSDPSISHSTDDPSKCYISGCNKLCDAGWTPVGRANTDANGKNRCPTRSVVRGCLTWSFADIGADTRN